MGRITYSASESGCQNFFRLINYFDPYLFVMPVSTKKDSPFIQSTAFILALDKAALKLCTYSQAPLTHIGEQMVVGALWLSYSAIVALSIAVVQAVVSVNATGTLNVR